MNNLPEAHTPNMDGGWWRYQDGEWIRNTEASVCVPLEAIKNCEDFCADAVLTFQQAPQAVALAIHGAFNNLRDTAEAAPQAEPCQPVATLVAMDKPDKQMSAGLFSVIVHDRDKCYDGMALYPSPPVVGRDQIIEECARVCDAMQNEADTWQVRSAAEQLAYGIRALIGSGRG